MCLLVLILAATLSKRRGNENSLQLTPLKLHNQQYFFYQQGLLN